VDYNKDRQLPQDKVGCSTGEQTKDISFWKLQLSSMTHYIHLNILKSLFFSISLSQTGTASSQMNATFLAEPPERVHDMDEPL